MSCARMMFSNQLGRTASKRDVVKCVKQQFRIQHVLTARKGRQVALLTTKLVVTDYYFLCVCFV